ncbi:MAG: DUF2156 domain-containing protein [Oscillospiraceae bacterium]|nr:DUF2156 domain-containing protein [Oscillospiraceae bacterium]
MINFQKFDPQTKAGYLQALAASGERGCEYSYANLNLWGRQRVAVVDGFYVLFSQFERLSIYPFPVGSGDIRPVLDAIIQDARERGIVCRLSGLTPGDTMLLEELYPGQFRFHPDRDYCDYVYDINDLADLKGRKYQKKRNHSNRFWQSHPNCTSQPITAENLPAVEAMVEAWYAGKMAADPNNDYHLERKALQRAFSRMDELGLEGLVLVEDGNILAMTMGSALSADTFDIHFEKAMDYADGAYPAIAQAFAAHLRSAHPELRFLNREDDMGILGLRQSKLSYCPHHLVVKFWARLWEDDDED